MCIMMIICVVKKYFTYFRALVHIYVYVIKKLKARMVRSSNKRLDL